MVESFFVVLQNKLSTTFPSMGTDVQILQTPLTVSKVLNYGIKMIYFFDFHHNLDIFMSILNNEENFVPDQSVVKPGQTNLERINELLDSWETSQEKIDFEASIPQFSTENELSKRTMKHKSGFSNQFNYLFGRAGKNALRNPLILRAKVGLSSVLPSSSYLYLNLILCIYFSLRSP